MTILSLNEASKLAANGGDMLKAGVIAYFAERSDVLNAFKVDGIMGNSVTYTQEGTLPGNAFRGVGEGFTASQGTFKKQTEALFIIGGEIDIDLFELKTMGEGIRDRHTNLKLKGIAQTVTDVIINGSNATEPREFDGLKTRITESAQLIANGSASGGDALSLKNLDKLIDSVDGGTHLIMSRAMRRKFMAAYRSSTFPNILMNKNESGSMVMSYGDLPILVGYPPNKNTAILPFTEANPGGGSAVGSSVYCVNLNEDGVVLIDNGGIQVRPLGELNSLPVQRTRIEWYLSMATYSEYARARLYGIKDADIVA